jgi:hypothetical protein
LIRFLVAHGLWVLGAAAMLASFSYFTWVARAGDAARSRVWRERPVWAMITAGGLLAVAAGFLLMDGARWWQRGVWVLVGAGAVRALWTSGLRRRHADAGVHRAHVVVHEAEHRKHEGRREHRADDQE